MANVLHMNGGLEETSYALNSLLQRKGITRTLPITKENVAELMRSSSFPKGKGRLVMADLGCASGPNTLLLMSEVIKFVHNLSKELGQESPELQIFLNDLPGNDFNHGLEENKGNIYLASSSPPGVLEAYYRQFHMDFSSFLKSKSQELVIGGRMVLTLPGRRGEESSEKECCYIWELMSIALNQMASEGLIDQQKLDSFNLPMYMPSAMEVEAEVEKQGSFAIEHLELWDMNWDAYEGEVMSLPAGDGGYKLSKCMEAVFGPIIAHHFDSSREIIDEVFRRYGLLLSDWMAKESPTLVSLTVSLTKRY
ncbi:unnamed protein product [Linum trigynum]|uniref:Uncharacterized protein n=1 Tax=Linum trigynum TaxID=586398 RepID=A0AAV2EPA1_9ROSI